MNWRCLFSQVLTRKSYLLIQIFFAVAMEPLFIILVQMCAQSLESSCCLCSMGLIYNQPRGLCDIKPLKMIQCHSW